MWTGARLDSRDGEGHRVRGEHEDDCEVDGNERTKWPADSIAEEGEGLQALHSRRDHWADSQSSETSEDWKQAGHLSIHIPVNIQNSRSASVWHSEKRVRKTGVSLLDSSRVRLMCGWRPAVRSRWKNARQRVLWRGLETVFSRRLQRAWKTPSS